MSYQQALRAYSPFSSEMHTIAVRNGYSDTVDQNELLTALADKIVERLGIQPQQAPAEITNEEKAAALDEAFTFTRGEDGKVTVAMSQPEGEPEVTEPEATVGETDKSAEGEPDAGGSETANLLKMILGGKGDKPADAAADNKDTNPEDVENESINGEGLVSAYDALLKSEVS